MARAATFPRWKARKRRRRVLRDHWRRLLVLAAIFAGIGAAIGLVFPGWRVRVWALPLAAFVMVAGVAHPLIDGTYHLWAADEAEGWTASELKKLNREGWSVMGPVPFEYRDVDHVAVKGSQVFAIDTKYTDSETDLAGYRDRQIVKEWADKACDAGQSLRSLLTLAHRLDVEVIRMVVVWGPEVTGQAQVLDGVIVVKGRHLQDELRERCGATMSNGLQERVVAAVEDFRGMRAQHQRAMRRARPKR